MLWLVVLAQSKISVEQVASSLGQRYRILVLAVVILIAPLAQCCISNAH